MTSSPELTPLPDELDWDKEDLSGPKDDLPSLPSAFEPFDDGLDIAPAKEGDGDAEKTLTTGETADTGDSTNNASGTVDSAAKPNGEVPTLDNGLVDGREYTAQLDLHVEHTDADLAAEYLVDHNSEDEQTGQMEKDDMDEEMNDPFLMGILQSLQAREGDEGEQADQGDQAEGGPVLQSSKDDEDGQVNTVMSSPLSEVPDLPHEPLSSPEPPAPKPLPEPTETMVTDTILPLDRDTSRADRPPPPATIHSFAESSSAARNRFTMHPSTSGHRSWPMSKVNTASSSSSHTGKRPRWPSHGSPGKQKKDVGDEGKGRAVPAIGTDGMDVDGPDDRNTALEDLKVELVEINSGDEDEVAKKRRKLGKPNGGAKASAKSRKRLDTVLGIGRLGESPLDKIAPKSKVWSDAHIQKFLTGRTREVQLGGCLKPRYAKWGKCTQCIAKLGGDSCRFRDYRVFQIDPVTTEILGPGWFESTEWKEEPTPMPTEFNVPFAESHMLTIESTVAPLLLPLVTHELRHVVKHKAIKRGVDAAKHRAVCDFCSSTIFGGWFFCKKCGRDYCLTCERYFSDSFDNMGTSPWVLPDAARPRLLRCVVSPLGEGGGVKNKPFHFRPDLQPVSRFGEVELREHWGSLAKFVINEAEGRGEPVVEGESDLGRRLKLLGLKEPDEALLAVLEEWSKAKSNTPPRSKPTESTLNDGLASALPPGPANGLSDDDLKAFYTKVTNRNPGVVPIPDPAKLEAHSRPFIFIHQDDLDDRLFDQLWARGEPMVVDGVSERFKLGWTPRDFIDRFGNEQCDVVDCESNAAITTTIQRFFTLFQDRDNRSQGILKLKDWPTTADFKSTHPELYSDFSEAIPVPNYTRREGVLNLYAHFPPGPTRPDIGPKMYNAFAAKESEGGHGSTRLHMDVADAINVMLYASDRPDGQPGCAVWDLFRAEDADKLRLYLKKKFDRTHVFTDPIHSQLFYLDDRKRREVFELFGVVSWRVYQYPGQAVFIPAGCAHQVCNLSDCIKIALDFVSPHNVSRCQKLSQDFRMENFVKAWKDDVLQLYNVLWYAWTNCRETRSRRHEEDLAREAEAKIRAARLFDLQNGSLSDAMSASAAASSVGIPLHMRIHSHGHAILSPNVSSMRDEAVTSPFQSSSRHSSSSPSRSGGWTPQTRGGTPTIYPGGDDGTGYRGQRDGEGRMDRVHGEDGSEMLDNGNSGQSPGGAEPTAGVRLGQGDFVKRLMKAVLDAPEQPQPKEVYDPSAASASLRSSKNFSSSLKALPKQANKSSSGSSSKKPARGVSVPTTQKGQEDIPKSTTQGAKAGPKVGDGGVEKVSGEDIQEKDTQVKPVERGQDPPATLASAIAGTAQSGGGVSEKEASAPDGEVGVPGAETQRLDTTTPNTDSTSKPSTEPTVRLEELANRKQVSSTSDSTVDGVDKVPGGATNQIGAISEVEPVVTIEEVLERDQGRSEPQA